LFYNNLIKLLIKKIINNYLLILSFLLLIKAKLGLALDVLLNIIASIFEYIKLVLKVIFVLKYNNANS
jgi:hypothetical protein